MPKRLVIPVEFSSVKDDEILLYMRLRRFSNAGAIIKDILKGNLPVSILNDSNDRSEVVADGDTKSGE